ncbi:NADPH-dependent FMN reductase [Bosea sp. PAMC 26642]|uniref:NADPH-dependent FMN reductase n=1 Tax=Bosea sp. (strain PAMC 26642) TaxID=1792307 RepID=UPI00076FFB1E|nr:NADPH-dependent FMN reductase [Bosea sp. PAMC 26642]AMJ60744.1 ACP phosphodiesterase [Bosea sp. PAMC 26642]
MAKFKLAVITGSNRSASINRKVALALAKLGAASFEMHVVRIDDLPMYNQDLEGAAWPQAATRLKDEIASADAVLVVTPEHNRSIPAVLKNAIDWAARPSGKGVWSGKPIAITGTSPGAIGTALAQQHLRDILGNQGALVMGGPVFLTYKQGLVDDAHDVTDAGTREFLQGFIDRFASLVAKLAA